MSLTGLNSEQLQYITGLEMKGYFEEQSRLKKNIGIWQITVIFSSSVACKRVDEL
jgi:hypothetical protein